LSSQKPASGIQYPASSTIPVKGQTLSGHTGKTSGLPEELPGVYDRCFILTLMYKVETVANSRVEIYMAFSLKIPDLPDGFSLAVSL